MGTWINEWGIGRGNRVGVKAGWGMGVEMG